LSQTILPTLLYIPGVQFIRVPIRMSAFAVSLFGLAWYGKKIARSGLNAPALKWLAICFVYLGLMIFHPRTNSLLAGIAQVMLYLSVLAPMFWASHLKYTPQRVQRLLFIILVCSGINALVGVLQVYDPSTWLPKDFSTVMKSQEGYLDSLAYTRANGSRTVRPPGLSDAPGAVCGPAATAGVLGLIFCFAPVSARKRVIAMVAAILGFVALFLSQVRTSLLIACGSVLVYIGLLLLQRQKKKAATLILMMTLVVGGAFVWALAVGGETIGERVGTLFESDPNTVYYNAGRGSQLAYAFTDMLFDYPAGAGLGRWGMMRYYFADPTNTESPAIWSELQPNSWILDGGIVLLLFYPIALIATTRDQLRIARVARSPDLRFVAAAIIAVNATALGLVFGYTPFTTQVGLQYWFLSGVLFAVAYRPAT
jgi:hypothetical protein